MVMHEWAMSLQPPQCFRDRQKDSRAHDDRRPRRRLWSSARVVEAFPFFRSRVFLAGRSDPWKTRLG